MQGITSVDFVMIGAILNLFTALKITNNWLRKSVVNIIDPEVRNASSKPFWLSGEFRPGYQTGNKIFEGLTRRQDGSVFFDGDPMAIGSVLSIHYKSFLLRARHRPGNLQLDTWRVKSDQFTKNKLKNRLSLEVGVY